MRPFSQSIVETVREPLLILDDEQRVRNANNAFYQTFRADARETEGRALYELGNGEWNIPRLRRLLDEVGSTGQSFRDFEVVQDFPNLGRRVLLLNSRRVYRDDDHAPMVLLAIEDVTETKKAQDSLRQLNAELEHRVRERTAQLEASNRELEAFCYSVSHDLRAPLRAIDGFSQELLGSYAERLDKTGQHYLQRIRAGSQRMAQLIDDMLQLSRLTRSDMHARSVDLSAWFRRLRPSCGTENRNARSRSSSSRG